MPIDRNDFRRVLGNFASGVTVVTTVGSDGNPYGLTVTAFTAVSLEPPLVLVCVDKRAESLPHLQSSQVFAVNFLASGEQETSRRFAVTGGDKFGGVAWGAAGSGAPILPNVVGYVDCRVVNTVEAGDHIIFIGQVDAAAAGTADPLLHFRGGYREVK